MDLSSVVFFITLWMQILTNSGSFKIVDQKLLHLVKSCFFVRVKLELFFSSVFLLLCDSSVSFVICTFVGKLLTIMDL